MPRFASIPALVEEDLVLPIPGADGVEREYRIKPATAAQFLTLQVVAANEKGQEVSGADREALESIKTFEEVWAQTLGLDTVRAMVKDGISSQFFRRASQTAYQWHITGGDSEAALGVWLGKGQTESPTDSETPSIEDGAEVSEALPAPTPGTTSRRGTSSGSRRTVPPVSDGPTSGQQEAST